MTQNQTAPVIVYEGSTIYPCNLCLKAFQTKKNLNKHRLLHRRSNVCAHCNLGFSTLPRLTAHIRTHFDKNASKPNDGGLSGGTNVGRLDNKPFVCAECDEGFLLRQRLILHLKTHVVHEKLPFICFHCKERFHSQLNLNIHTKKHTRLVMPFPCFKCTRSFISQGNLAAHIMNHHKQNDETALNTTCPQCGAAFKATINLDAHIEVHMEKGDTNWLCKCGERFDTNVELVSHVTKNPDHANHIYFPCSYCDVSFFSHVGLMSHINKVHIQKYKCPDCGEWFRFEVCFKAHRLTHTQHFECNKCDATFSIFDSLTRHLLESHKGEQVCQYCKRDLKSLHNLRRHIRVFHAKDRARFKALYSKSKSSVFHIKKKSKQSSTKKKSHAKANRQVSHCKEMPETSSCDNGVTENGSKAFSKSSHSEETQCTQCGEVFDRSVTENRTVDTNPIICPQCSKDFLKMFGIKIGP